MLPTRPGDYVPHEGLPSIRNHTVQGKPVARRGRKARDLSETARLPVPVNRIGLGRSQS
jgi:hypothetical protein